MILHRLHIALRQAQNLLKIRALVGRAERDGRAVKARAARAADAVHIRLGHLGNIKIDDMGQLVNVDAARRDIGGHKDAAAPLLERGQRILPGVLRLVPMNGSRGKARAAQIARDAVRPMLRAGKDQHGNQLRVREQMGQQLALVLPVDKINVLADFFDRRGGRRNLHHRHIVQQPIRDLLDFRRHGGRKQQRLLLLRRFVDHAANVVDKAHIEHAIGFVQHKNFQIGKAHISLTNEIVEPSGRCDQHIHALFERLHLRSLSHPAEHHGGAQAQVLSVHFKVLVDLQRQLPRRGEHQRTDRPFPLRRGAFCQNLQDRHSKRRRFSRSRLGAAEQIPAFQHRRNRGLLDRRRLPVTRLPQRIQNRRDQMKLFKRHTIHPNFIYFFYSQGAEPFFFTQKSEPAERISAVRVFLSKCQLLKNSSL